MRTESDDEDLIRQMVETIVAAVSPAKVILFGSRARGEARADSDVDLLIVEREPFGPRHSRREEAARLYFALRKLSMPKDLLVYSLDEFEQFKGSANHVIGRAAREGRVMHDCT